MNRRTLLKYLGLAPLSAWLSSRAEAKALPADVPRVEVPKCSDPACCRAGDHVAHTVYADKLRRPVDGFKETTFSEVTIDGRKYPVTEGRVTYSTDDGRSGRITARYEGLTPLRAGDMVVRTETGGVRRAKPPPIHPMHVTIDGSTGEVITAPRMRPWADARKRRL